MNGLTLALLVVVALAVALVLWAVGLYNDAVTAYNTKRELFPTSLVAGAFNFAAAALLEATDAAAQRDAPHVAF